MQSLGQPVRRVTIVLFADDCAALESRYGRGWTEQVRRMVHENCQQYRKYRKELQAYLEDENGN